MDSPAEEDSAARTAGHMTDLGCDDTPPLQLHTLKQFEQHLNDLKKENFSLKLRIYFLEERIQQKYEESSEDVYRSNIELKVEVESLKQELQEKQNLLDSALTTAETLTNHNEAELQRRCEDRQQEIDHMQQVLETKIQLLQEEAQLARSEAERLSVLAVSPSLDDAPMDDIMEEQRPSLTDSHRLLQELHCKDVTIAELSEQKVALTLRVAQLEGRVQALMTSTTHKDGDVELEQDELSEERLCVEERMKSLVEQQQSRLERYECAASQCVSELHKAQQQVQSLQARVNQSEANNSKLQEKLDEMECELHSLRDVAQSRERTILGLNDSISTKDLEARELYQLMEEQNLTLVKLQELVHRNQLSHHKTASRPGQPLPLSQLQGELVAAQSSVFSLGLELESSRRGERRSQRHVHDLTTANDRLTFDLQDALQHSHDTEKHNQDLRCSLQKLRSELHLKEAQLKESEAEQQAALHAKDATITRLSNTLQDKERLLREYSEMQESPVSGKPRDMLLEKMKTRIKERDKALERCVDEKFRSLGEREAELRSLQLGLREKERDLERLRCILSNNEHTITSLDAALRVKEQEVEQAAAAYSNLQWQQQQNDEQQKNTLRHKDDIIQQLQAALHTRSQETQELRASLVGGAQSSPSVTEEELKARLSLKDKLLEELLTDRSQVYDQHQEELQQLLRSLSAKDQYLQDHAHRLSQVIAERTEQLQEQRAQLKELQRHQGGGARQLRPRPQHTDSLDKQEEEEEEEVLQEELEEAQVTLSALQTAGDKMGAAHPKLVLELLVSEYEELNEALRAEKILYQTLTHTDSGSAETVALHTELDSVQALRRQLDEVLLRTRSLALTLERRLASPKQTHFGGGTVQDGANANHGGRTTASATC